MGGVKPTVSRNLCQHLFCEHAVCTVEERVILLPEAAIRY